MGVDHQPNSKLINARLRMKSPAGSGHSMSRQELAEAVNAWQWRARGKEDRLDETDIGRLERGEIRWPGRERREAFRAVLGASTEVDLGFYPHRRSRTRPGEVRPGPPTPTEPPSTAAGEPVVSGHRLDNGPEADLVEFVATLDQHGIGSAELTAVDLAIDRLDLDFARLPPDEVLAKSRLLMKRISAHLRQPQTLRHHERLVTLAARLAGLRAWACFDIDDHGAADRWYELAVNVAYEARAWALGAWLLGAQSLIPWHRRDLARTIELIERGIYFAGQGSDATTRAWLYALHARGCAGMGNSKGFDNAYNLAQEAAEYSNERDRRHGMDFAEGTLDLRYYSGTSRLLLRQPERAHSDLTGSLADLPESHTKARAVVTLFLADAAAQSGDLVQAVGLTQRALASTMHQPILPIIQQSRRTRRLIHQRDPAAATGLDDILHQFSRALTAIAGKATS